MSDAVQRLADTITDEESDEMLDSLREPGAIERVVAGMPQVGIAAFIRSRRRTLDRRIEAAKLSPEARRAFDEESAIILKLGTLAIRACGEAPT